jgi:hypothetical protein
MQDKLSSAPLLLPESSADKTSETVGTRSRIDSDTLFEKPNTSKCLRSQLARATKILAKAIVVSLAVFGVFNLSIRIHGFKHLTTDNEICNCGNSIAEALSLNCKFVPFASAWLPPACRDDELYLQYKDLGPGINGSWSYYADKHAEKEISVEEVAQLGDAPASIFYTTRKWHIIHCVFYWKKLHRSRRTGVIMEPRYDTESHIDHCMDLFLDAKDREKIGAKQTVALDSSVQPVAKLSK